MKTILTIISFSIIIMGYSQDSLGNKKCHFLNQYGLSTYAFSLFNNASNQLTSSQFKAGSEIHIDLFSFQHKRHQLMLSTGFFYISVPDYNPKNPRMRYFYFPLDLKYRLYSKQKRFYGEIGIGKPITLYEDSRYFNYDTFWLRYEDAMYNPTYRKEKFYAIHTLKFGYCINKHFSVNMGEMSYLFSTNAKRFKNVTRLAFGVEFRL